MKSQRAGRSTTFTGTPAARAAAALDGRVQVDEDDARLAASLILAPRAVTYPAPPEEEPDQPAPQDAPDPGEEDGSPTPQELAETLRTDYKVYGEVVKAAGLSGG